MKYTKYTLRIVATLLAVVATIMNVPMVGM